MATTSLAFRRVPRAARNYLTELWSRREFAWYLAMGNLKARNASTTLGLVWWVLNPVLLGAVYWLVFGLLFKRGTLQNGLPFLPYLLSGMFPFYFTQSAMTGGVNSIVSNTKLLANLRFPRLILPIAALIEGLVGFMTSLAVYYVIVGPLTGILPSSTIWWLIPAVIVHVIFNFGLSTIVARIAVPFRDLNNLVPYFTRIWLYLSPVIYEASFLEGTSIWVRRLFRFNPLFPILDLYRYALTGVAVDPAGSLLTATAWAFGLAIFGAAFFVKYEGKMARYV